MTAVFERIAVIGLGLLGGSVAAAAKRAGAARVVVGSTRSRDARELAVANGWVDEVGEALEAVRDADLVVLATPVYAMADAVRGLAPALRAGALVTDVGSVKAGLAGMLPGLLPSRVHYVGSHPMAGSHERGIEYARADLFEGAPCVVTETPNADARERVCAFWRALGARVVLRDAAAHDLQVAWASHVPHVLAFAFASAFRDAPAGARDLAGAGFRDFTRIAGSDPEIWADILTANRKAIAAPLAAVGEAFAELGRAIEANDAESVEHWIASARAGVALQSSSESKETAGESHRRDDNPTRIPATRAAPAGARE